MNAIAVRIPVVLAQASVDSLRAQIQDVLNIVMIFGFVYGTILIISGARQIRHGDYASGLEAIIAGLLIAAAPVIMRILFATMGNSTSL
ncbi:MAG TPA: hypothetical protein P5525_07515 [Candidatus Paceibacterota bacterium]|nr:hypothetical protein [Candidatus Paceibacterota bacterium]